MVLEMPRSGFEEENMTATAFDATNVGNEASLIVTPAKIMADAVVQVILVTVYNKLC